MPHTQTLPGDRSPYDLANDKTYYLAAWQIFRLCSTSASVVRELTMHPACLLGSLSTNGPVTMNTASLILFEEVPNLGGGTFMA